MTMPSFFARGAMTLLVALICAGPLRAADIEVKIENFTYNPQQITVKVGTTITWVNHDDIPHTVTSSHQAFKSQVIDTDEKFIFTFSTPGTFQYFCALHPHMTGSIVVEAASGK